MNDDPQRSSSGPQGGGSAESSKRSEGPVPSRLRVFLRIGWEWGRSVLIAFVLFVVIRTFFVEAFKIPTASMESTLLVGDFLLVNKAVYGAEIPGTNLRLPAFEEPGRGDVIVFNPPHDPDRNYVKRIVGMPRDTVEMRDKRILINGVAQREPHARVVDRRGDTGHPGMRWQYGYLIASLHASQKYRPSRDNWGPLVVPEGKYLVLGDNRDNSEDSRYWGFVDRERIRGRPLFVYYSFDPEGRRSPAWFREIRWSRIGTRIR